MRKRRAKAARRSRRKRSGGGFGGLPSARGFVSIPALKSAVVSAGGFIGSDIVLQKLPLPPAMKQGWGRVAALAAVGFGSAVIGRKVAGGVAAKFAEGCLIRAAFEGIRMVKPSLAPASLPGVSGLGYDSVYAYEQPMLSGLGGSSTFPTFNTQQPAEAFIAAQR